MNYPISKPGIAYYESHGAADSALTGSHSGTITINVNMAKDPDAPGTVNHSLYLCNSDGTYNTTLNSSFYSFDDSNVNVNFNTSTVPDAHYRMNVTAVAVDNETDIASYQTTTKMSVDNTVPNVTLQSHAANYGCDTPNVTFICNATDNLNLSCISLYIFNATSQYYWLNPTIYVSGTSTSVNWTLNLSNGNYTWNCLAHDAAGNSDWGDSSRTVTINVTKPDYSPDLRVVNVTFFVGDTSENKSVVSESGTGYQVKAGKSITVNATIANYGTGNVTSDFEVWFFDSVDGNNGSTRFWNYTYIVSAKGELDNITYATGYWNSSVTGTHNISVWADPENSAGESAENATNNNCSALIHVFAWQPHWDNVSELVLGVPEQGKIVIGEPVNWSQRIRITNHGNITLSNFSL